MGTPRKVTVSVNVGAGASPVDVTQDLISCTYEENLKEAGETLDISLDDASGRYRGIWFVDKGTQITATITTTDWLKPGDYASRSTGVMFVDTVELEAKPATVIIKATSISPKMQNDTDDHSGVEGQSVQDTIIDYANTYGLQTMDGNTGEATASDNSGAVTTDNNRQDQDNQGNLKWRREQARLVGNEVVARDNTIITINEKEMEAKAATKTLTDGVSPIIKGKFTTNSIGKYAASVVTHTDVKTGTVTTSGTVTPAKPPTGTNSTYKSRRRSLQPGSNDNATPKPNSNVAIGTGQPGNPFDTTA